jgi:hypothetical protein
MNMEPLSQEHADEVREIVKQEVARALDLIADEFLRMAESASRLDIYNAMRDAIVLYQRT